MLKKDLIFTILLLCSIHAIAQENLLCPLLVDKVKIQQPADIPTISSNADGTITLTHPNQNITAIFASYTIYDFYQTYPTSNPDGALFKYYSITHDNKDLITELNTNVSPDVYTFETPYSSTPISVTLIELLDDKTYKLIKYCNYSTENGTNCENDTYTVPEGFELNIAFDYDAENDIFNAETTSLSPCGNAFSIGLKGGFDEASGFLENELQLWTTSEGASSLSEMFEPCYHIEFMLYEMLDIGCIEYNYGNIRINQGDEDGQIVLQRENRIFSTDYMTFEQANLSIETEAFSKMIPFQTEGNPYLQIKNSKDQNIKIAIFDLSGKQILAERPFGKNSVDMSAYATGLYFIKLSNLNNQQKVFKFLKN